MSILRVVRLSLAAKLLLAFVAVSLVSTALFLVQVQRGTTRSFDAYVGDQRAEQWGSILAELYRAYGSWDSVGDISVLLLAARQPGGGWHREPGRPVSVAVIDAKGAVVLEGPGYPLGMAVPTHVRRRAAPIAVDDEIVGYLVVEQPMDTIRSAVEAAFLRRLLTLLLSSAAASAAVALVLGFLLSRSLTRPVRELTEASRQVAEGRLDVRVPVRSSDELGDLAAAFNSMNGALARAETLRKQMTADIAHELRTPLSLVLGHAEALDDGVLPPSPEALHIIHDEALRLSRLVGDLRTLSLSDAGALSLAVRPVRAEELLVRAATVHSPEARAKGVDIELACAPDLPDVSADPDRVGQILDNLIGNALRYTSSGGRITLSADGHHSPGSSQDAPFVLISVRDTGHGIPADELALVFERLHRADRSRSREEGGSGLGLAIARSLVEMHGGAMWAESTVGVGSTFFFTLPTQTRRGQEEEAPCALV